MGSICGATKRKPLGLCILLAIILVAPGVGGQERGGLELSPPAVEMVLNPGAERVQEIAIANSSDSKTVRIKLYVAAVTQDRTGGYVVAEEKQAAGTWLELPKDELILGPKSEELIKVKVKVPRNAVGSQVAAVVFEVATESANKRISGIGGEANFVHRLTSVFKITANSRANRKAASIQELKVVSGAEDRRYGKYGKNALALVCSVINDGNEFFATRGRLVLRNAEKRRVKDVPLGAGRGIILPGAVVDLASIFPAGLPSGEYTAEVTVYYGSSRPLQAKIPFTVKDKTATSGESKIAPHLRLTVTPDLLQTQLPGGAFRTFVLSLTNRESVPVKIRAFLKNMVSAPDGTLMELDNEDWQWSAIPWLRLEENELILEPGKKRNYRVTVAVPKDASGGSRFALLVFEAQRLDGAKQAAVTTVSTPIFLSMTGKTELKAGLDQVKAVPDPGGVWLFGGTLTNQGNTNLTFSGKINLYRKAKKPKAVNGLTYLGEDKWELVEAICLADTSGWLLPGCSRLLIVPYDKKLPFGEYLVEMVVDYGEKIPVKGSFQFRLAGDDSGKK